MLPKLMASGIWLALIGGCGSQLPTVQGLVTLDGEPLPNARVVFESPDRPMAVATTDNQGRYDVMTGTQRGMATGNYQVAISAYETRDGGSESPVPILSTPKRYNSAQTSGLSVEITPGRNSEVNFQLETN
jgi:hypothetical protein